jgi:hypothetical protein
MFLVRFFYELAKNPSELQAALNAASGIDDDTGMFELFC